MEKTEKDISIFRSDTISAVKMIAIDDIRPGMYVTPMSMIDEQAPFFTTICDERGSNRKPIRYRMISPGAGFPYKVIDACVPFVLAEDPEREHVVFDVRRYRLAHLPKSPGQGSMMRIRDDIKRRRQRKRK